MVQACHRNPSSRRERNDRPRIANSKQVSSRYHLIRTLALIRFCLSHQTVILANVTDLHSNHELADARHPGQAADLPPVFSPAAAAEVLGDLGLTGITECALRTRAYRKQVPFHLNGRRITFTLADLRVIAEGEACTPQPQAQRAQAIRVTRRPAPPRGRRPSSGRPSCTEDSDPWRAHLPRGRQASPARRGASDGH